MVTTKIAKSLGVKSGYQAFSIAGLRGTIYVPKGFFAANGVPETLEISAPFAEPAAAKPEVAALLLEVAALKAALASATPALVENGAPGEVVDAA